MSIKIHSIKPVSDVTGFSPSTIRRYLNKYPHFFSAQRVRVGDKDYRVFTWREVEMLIYLRQKMGDGASPTEAWESAFNFFANIDVAAEMINEQVEPLVQQGIEFWDAKTPNDMLP
ncbi:MAG: hypothetical protein ACLP5H_02310 [Desulfomonilaceae bacterium]